MKTIGLLGGMSWESTVTYYQLLNRAVQARLGGLHSAKILLYSVDFAEIEACQTRGDWHSAGERLAHAARALQDAGAEVLLLCTNTMHKVAPHITAAIDIPFLHIADATADALARHAIRRVGLLGTRYTMTQDFYKQRLADRGFEVLIPEAPEIDAVHCIIFEELCRGRIQPKSRRQYQAVIEHLQRRGAEAVIFGCTEIGLLVRPEDAALPVFDTTVLHAEQAAAWALA